MTRQKETHFFRTLLIVIALLAAAFISSQAWATSLEQIRVGQNPDKTRVVFDIKNNHSFTVKHLANPARIVVDFNKADNQVSFDNKKLLDQRVKAIQVESNKQRTRVVLELRDTFDYSYFTLGKNKAGAERVVIDVKADKVVAKAKPAVVTPVKAKETPKVLTVVETVKKVTKAPEVPVLAAAEPVKSPIKITERTLPVATLVESKSMTEMLNAGSPLVEKEELVVAIDAGHGGKDTGAIGRGHKAYEKNVTLAMAKKLKKFIDAQPGMRAVLTREDDVFIPLHKRVQIAHQKDADIFISLHADSFPSSDAKGGSVYVLSTNGASSVMARLLAKSENASLHDIKLKGRDSDVAFVLSDLSREANIRASRKLAQAVLGEMADEVTLHKETVQSADFAVLKSIDMPSLLIETAFISNPTEEKKLLSDAYQAKMAKSIASGIASFVNKNAKEPRWGETLYVQYKVKSGDTLSEIAANYDISTLELKKLNKIKNSNQLFVGRKLKIPLSESVVASL